MHSGHVRCCRSQGSTHSLWNSWAQEMILNSCQRDRENVMYHWCASIQMWSFSCLGLMVYLGPLQNHIMLFCSFRLLPGHPWIPQDRWHRLGWNWSCCLTLEPHENAGSQSNPESCMCAFPTCWWHAWSAGAQSPGSWEEIIMRFLEWI